MGKARQINYLMMFQDECKSEGGKAGENTTWESAIRQVYVITFFSHIQVEKCDKIFIFVV